MTFLYRRIFFNILYNFIMKTNKNPDEFLRERITELRIKKGVSESQMSYDLGHSRSYINNITSGKSLPSMIEFFYICDYFEITPIEFYNIENKNPSLIHVICQKLEKLEEKDLLLILELINRMQHM